MVRHIVWWTLKPEAEGRTAAENAKLIKQRLEALIGQIPSLKSLEVSYDFLPTCTMQRRSVSPHLLTRKRGGPFPQGWNSPRAASDSASTRCCSRPLRRAVQPMLPYGL